jgi:hypothetical protein
VVRIPAARGGETRGHVNDHDIDPAGLHIGQQLTKSGTVHRSTGEAAVIIADGQGPPALARLALDVGRAGLTLGIEAVEGLLQPLLRALAGIERAPPERLRRERGRSPKKRGPFQRDPAMAVAAAKRLR